MASEDNPVERPSGGRTVDIEKALRALVEEETPHNRLLGLRLERTGPGQATCLLPYSKALVGDLQTGGIHGGAIAALIDVASGAAVAMRLGQCRPMATLELRVDHLQSAKRVRALRARAECLKLMPPLAFVRTLVEDEDGAELVASAQGTFVLLEP